ncbi:ATP-dependent (S)-NAD(P)H-hydrate dehydratase [Periplaneta americana]|uniref:ATP-dependent (S)-NAD(P)H-hydrate dehydratase n=1 Tax=Periplaneta americana TaxID=6978 RepID=UPI0037E83460
MFTFVRPVIGKVVTRYTKYVRELATSSIMGCEEELSQLEDKLLKESRAIVPLLRHDMYKGQAGRIGIIGGSLDYTGAPYFSAISALKVGCDLSHVFCPQDAAAVIKAYSPELIVHPILDTVNALDLVKPWLPRLHVLVIGPGLGRDPRILETVGSIIKFCRDHPDNWKPLVIDADGLFMITEKPDIIRNYPMDAILTPNAIEFSRLAKSVLNKSWAATPNPDPDNVRALAVALGTNIIIVHKGASDIIASGSDNGAVVKCATGGSCRRCGGQGDLLSGSLGVFCCWAGLKAARDPPESVPSFPPAVIAAYAGCRLTRECNQRAVAKAGRSTLTTDMLEEIHAAFEALFEN